MKQVQKPRKPLIVYYLIAIAVLILFNSFVFPAIVGGNVEEVDYGTFLTMVENKEVSKVQLEGESIYFTDKSEDSRQYETTRFDDPDLVNRLEKAGCKFGRVADRQMSPFLSMLLSIVIPMIIHSPRTVFVTSTHEKDGRSGRRKPVYAVWKEQCKSICAVYDGYYV